MSERSRGSDGSSGPGTQNSPSAGDDIYAAAAASAAGRNARRGGAARAAHGAGSTSKASDETATAGRALPDSESPSGGAAKNAAEKNGAASNAAASNGSQPKAGSKPADAEAPAESTSRFGSVASSVLNRVRPGSKDDTAAADSAGSKPAAQPKAANTTQPKAANTTQPKATNTTQPKATNTAQAAAVAPSPSSAGDTASEATAALPREQLLPAAAVATKPAKADKAAKADKPKAGVAKGTRKARLRLSRLDPWSVMKTAFLFSIAAGIVLVVAVYAVWLVIGSSGLFSSIDSIVGSVLQSPGDSTPFKVEDYVNTQKVMGVTAFLACIDVVIFTALATLASFLYNLAATMLGGLEVTLAED